MPSFLAVYAASFPTVGTHETIKRLFSDAANKIFSKTRSDEEVKKYSLYDNLIMTCTYQKPLLFHKPDVVNGCLDFNPILTSNGLCHSFNGIDTEQVWKKSEIVKSFSTIFDSIETQRKKFRGIGPSEG